jgi:hypothetical protein
LVVFFTAVRDHDRSQPDTYLCQRDPAAVSGPSPGPDPGNISTFRNNHQDGPCLLSSAQIKVRNFSNRQYRCTVHGCTVFAHLYAIHKVPWHCALAPLAPEDGMPAENITHHRSQPIQPRRSRLLLRGELTAQRIARQVPTSMARLGPK